MIIWSRASNCVGHPCRRRCRINRLLTLYNSCFYLRCDIDTFLVNNPKVRCKSNVFNKVRSRLLKLVEVGGLLIRCNARPPRPHSVRKAAKVI
jgi:hypothetical protein